MNPEQVERVFVSLGELKAVMSEHSKDIKAIKDTVTGNGHPEQSMVAVLHDTRRVVLELRERQNGHEARLKTLEDCRAKEATRKEVSAETKKKIFGFVSVIFKNNPVLASAVTAVLGGLIAWLGFAL
jgi:hypothetical protein